MPQTAPPRSRAGVTRLLGGVAYGIEPREAEEHQRGAHEDAVHVEDRVGEGRHVAPAALRVAGRHHDQDQHELDDCEACRLAGERAMVRRRWAGAGRGRAIATAVGAGRTAGRTRDEPRALPDAQAQQHRHDHDDGGGHDVEAVAVRHVELKGWLVGVHVQQRGQVVAEAARHGGHAQCVLQHQARQRDERGQLAKRDLARRCRHSVKSPRQGGRVHVPPRSVLRAGCAGNAGCPAPGRRRRRHPTRGTPHRVRRSRLRTAPPPGRSRCMKRRWRACSVRT